MYHQYYYYYYYQFLYVPVLLLLYFFNISILLKFGLMRKKNEFYTSSNQRQFHLTYLFFVKVSVLYKIQFFKKNLLCQNRYLRKYYVRIHFLKQRLQTQPQLGTIQFHVRCMSFFFFFLMDLGRLRLRVTPFLKKEIEFQQVF